MEEDDETAADLADSAAQVEGEIRRSGRHALATASEWTGRRVLVTDVLPEHSSAAQAYLCGPPGMIDAGIERLTRSGLPLGSIFCDRFTDSRDVA